MPTARWRKGPGWNQGEHDEQEVIHFDEQTRLPRRRGRRRGNGLDALGGGRAGEGHQGRLPHDSVRACRPARHVVAQRGADGSREGQCRRRSRRTDDRTRRPRHQGPAAGSRPRRPRARQLGRLRDADRRRSVDRCLRRARGGARPRHPLPPHQFGNIIAQRRSQAAPAPTPSVALARASTIRSLAAAMRRRSPTRRI